MPTLQIDGRVVAASDGESVLDAARGAGIRIPTLCHHPALEAWGGCRLCLVEVGPANRPAKLVTACTFPAEDGLVVHTRSQAVLEARRVVVDLLLARCPHTPAVLQLAREHGIEATSYAANPEPTDCVLCGLCTRVCARVGVSAISSVSRGVEREIGVPFDEPPADCIGCLACAEICPTGHIPFEASGTVRRIWGRTFEMQACVECGRAHVTRAQAAHEEKRHGLPGSYFELCDACKRRRLAATFVSLQAR